MERLGAYKFGVCKLIYANLGGICVKTLCDFVKGISVGGDILCVVVVEVDLLLGKAINRSYKQFLVRAEKIKGCIVGIGVPLFVIAKDCLQPLKPLEVCFVLPEELVIKAENELNSEPIGRTLVKGFSNCLLVGNDTSLDSFFHPRTFLRSATTVYELGAILTVHIFRCVLEFSDYHCFLLNPGIKKAEQGENGFPVRLMSCIHFYRCWSRCRFFIHISSSLMIVSSIRCGV